MCFPQPHMAARFCVHQIDNLSVICYCLLSLLLLSLLLLSLLLLSAVVVTRNRACVVAHVWVRQVRNLSLVCYCCCLLLSAVVCRRMLAWHWFVLAHTFWFSDVWQTVGAIWWPLWLCTAFATLNLTTKDWTFNIREVVRTWRKYRACLFNFSWSASIFRRVCKSSKQANVGNYLSSSGVPHVFMLKIGLKRRVTQSHTELGKVI
jgi:hypothetical protein